MNCRKKFLKDIALTEFPFSRLPRTAWEVNSVLGVTLRFRSQIPIALFFQLLGGCVFFYNVFRKPPRKFVGQCVRPTGLTFVSGPLSRESRLSVLQGEGHRGASHTLGPPWVGSGRWPTWRQGEAST